MLFIICLSNSLFLHCTSLSVQNNFATTKGAVIFTGRLKRGNYGPFCSPKVLMLLIVILIILPS